MITLEIQVNLDRELTATVEIRVAGGSQDVRHTRPLVLGCHAVGTGAHTIHAVSG